MYVRDYLQGSENGRVVTIGYEIAILWYEMVNYGTKWLWCKIHMVRNGFWLWYEIAILWYEIINYGTKWLWYEMTSFVPHNSLHS